MRTNRIAVIDDSINRDGKRISQFRSQKPDARQIASMFFSSMVPDRCLIFISTTKRCLVAKMQIFISNSL